MPTIQQHKTGGKIIFNEVDWLAGLNPQYTASALASQKIGNGLANTISFNPYREFGYASPGYNPTNLTNVAVIDAVQKNCVVSGIYAYSVGGTKVHQITLSSETITPATDPVKFPHAVASSVMEDIIVYNIGAIAYLFYSWYDETDGDIGRYDFATTFVDNWLSTVPSSAAVLAKSKPMPMIVGSDDVLYVADGNNVHALDGQEGADGTLYKNVLTIPTAYKITGFARYGEQLAIFATTAGDSFYLAKSTVFFWNYLDLDPTKVVDLNDNYVSAPFEWKGTIGCFTQGRAVDKTQATKYCKLKIYNGSQFETVAVNIGNAPVFGGVDVVGDMIQWNSQGKIYSYGSPFLGIENKFNYIASGTGVLSGFLKTLTTVIQIASTGITTTGGMQSLNTNYAASARVATAYAKPNFPVGKQGKIKTIITKYGKASAAGRTLSLKLRDRVGNILVEFINEASLIAEADYVNKYEDANDIFDDLRLIATWSDGSAATDAPIIDSVEVEFEYVNL